MEHPNKVLDKLLDLMRPCLVAAKIPKNQIHIRGGNHRIDTRLKAFDWLHDIFMSREYRHHLYVYSLVTPEIWKNYEMLGLTGLREQEMLKKSSKNVRALWKLKRPQIFGETKRYENHKKTH